MTRISCAGLPPLTGRLEPWQAAVCDDADTLAVWLDEHGSPLNVLETGPFAANAAALERAALPYGLALKIFFARKANKALAFVDAARDLGLGVDVASERELQQVLERGVDPARIVLTAAVKPRPLLALAVASGATVVIDNADELALLRQVGEGASRDVPVAFRLAPVLPGRTPTRFGMGREEILGLVDTSWPSSLAIVGVHFHLDGYLAAERALGVGQSVELVDALRARGHRPSFVDIGGGIPMRYLDDEAEWERFWHGDDAPQMFDGHRLGTVYPAWQAPVRGRWLDDLLGTGLGDGTVASALRERDLELRCEPGRALLDGCGLTAARVEFRKRRADGTWLIGLAMNRTQCRSAADDFLVDPLLVRPGRTTGGSTGPIDGFLVGAYCIERELLAWRRLRFADGVEVGDIVVFPNTAGYLMHILESASHQIPLARNVLCGRAGSVVLDAIDAGGSLSPR